MDQNSLCVLVHRGFLCFQFCFVDGSTLELRDHSWWCLGDVQCGRLSPGRPSAGPGSYSLDSRWTLRPPQQLANVLHRDQEGIVMTFVRVKKFVHFTSCFCLGHIQAHTQKPPKHTTANAQPENPLLTRVHILTQVRVSGELARSGLGFLWVSRHRSWRALGFVLRLGFEPDCPVWRRLPQPRSLSWQWL